MAWFVVLASAPQRSPAQADLPIYTDHLVNGFQDWSWASRNLANTSPVHSGAHSISVNDVAWTGISFHQAGFNNYQGGFDVSGYTNLSFWADGGTGGGQQIQVYAGYGATNGPRVLLSALPANGWRQYTVSLSALGVAAATNVSRLTWQLTSSGTTNAFYLDDIQLTAMPGPALVRIQVNAGHVLRAVDPRWFGLNTAIWDSDFDTPQTVQLLREAGARLLRFPGGSLSDEYHWASDTTLGNTWRWATSFSNFIHVATNVGAQAIITVNYGTGTPAEAAAWVRDANVTNHLGFQYWEIGNECYGSWEADSNTQPHDPYTYAVRAADYIAQMKAADPAIRIGVVAAPGQDSFANYTNHPATNSLTGRVHYGWTPVLLSTLKNLGVTPDFLVNHRYPEYSTANGAACADSDALLLQSAPAWAGDAADLRNQINAYFGAGGSNMELFVTENNSDAGAQGRQSTSLVNALYYADSLGQLMQTEFKAFVWWDFRNGGDTQGSFDPTLYGWRTNGDLGMVGGATNCYPAFHAAELMQYFARPGDSVLEAASDESLLSAYAVRRADGALNLLVINKSGVTNVNAAVVITNFTPFPAATVRSYGIAQDEAARTNASPSLQGLALTNFPGSSTNFDYSFPPYSLTLLTFAPAPAQLLPGPASGGQFILQLQGQPGTPYVLQSSPDLLAWTSVETDTLAGTVVDLTNVILAGSSRWFWRAIWQP
ncbi:MAG: alpha-L-arabinofuranosidase [Verrucomicrobiota bacterium]|nr:alpha-L-arabinofuranosidase [Verrucomicrobiota bacterium]